MFVLAYILRKIFHLLVYNEVLIYQYYDELIKYWKSDVNNYIACM